MRTSHSTAPPTPPRSRSRRPLSLMTLVLATASARPTNPASSFRSLLKATTAQSPHADTLVMQQTTTLPTRAQKMCGVETDPSRRIDARPSNSSRRRIRSAKEAKTQKETREALLAHRTHAARALVALVRLSLPVVARHSRPLLRHSQLSLLRSHLHSLRTTLPLERTALHLYSTVISLTCICATILRRFYSRTSALLSHSHSTPAIRPQR